jgi:hypothetical protein
LKLSILKIVEYVDGTAENLYNIVKKLFNKYEIPLTNIKGLSTDGANAMSGEYNSVMSRLKKDNPDMFQIKCMAHSAALIAAHASEELPERLTKIMDQVASYFTSSPKRAHLFKDIQGFCDVPVHNLLSRTKTRWLSMESWVPLQCYFKEENEGKNCLNSAKEIYAQLCNYQTYCYLLFIKEALGEINNFNVLFQSNETQIQ